MDQCHMAIREYVNEKKIFEKRDSQSSNKKGSVMLISTQHPSPITHHLFSIASLTNEQQDNLKDCSFFVIWFVWTRQFSYKN